MPWLLPPMPPGPRPRVPRSTRWTCSTCAPRSPRRSAWCRTRSRGWSTRRCCRSSASAFEEHRFPKELVPELAALGLLGSSIEGYGCAGLNAVSYGLICQELERGDSGIRSFVSVQSSLCMYPIYAFGSEEQKQKYLPRMARGELIGCFGLTEPHGGSDPANMKTHAKRRGEDWVLNGAKMWITNGAIADLCRRVGDDRGRHPRLHRREGHAGILRRRRSSTSSRCALRSPRRCSSTTSSCPKNNVLPGVVGLKGPLSCLTQARYGIAWGVIGAAQACLAQLLDYTDDARAFRPPAGAEPGHPDAPRRDGAAASPPRSCWRCSSGA